MLNNSISTNDELYRVCDGVTNFTVADEAVNFKKACDEYNVMLGTIGGQDCHAGVIEYVPLN